MKICLITSWFPSKERPYIAPFVYHFANRLGESGMEVSVLTVLGIGDEAKIEQGYLTIYRVNRKFALISILRLVDQIKPDIIHVHAPNFFGSLAIVVARLKKIPIIATVYRAEIDIIKGPILFHFRKFALRRFQRIIALSNFSKSLALKAGAQENRLFVVYNSCDESLFFPKDKLSARRKLNLPPEKKIILFVGNLIELKGIFTLMDSLKTLREVFPDYLALIVGRGEQATQEKLNAKVNEYHLTDKIKFVGWYRQNELANFYDAADIFILPSITEGHSIALLEAMASGLPIVASDIEGNRESINDGVNGLLFETGNANALAEKIVTVLNDSKLQNQMSTMNPKIYSQKFSTEAQIQNYLKIYKPLVEKKRKKNA